MPERLSVPGGSLAVWTEGAGSPVVFVHAAIADHRMWTREAHALAGAHRTVRYDLRGYGGSTPATGAFSFVDDLHRLIEHYRLDRPWVVACSMGGRIAVDYAVSHPNSISGLLLVAPGLSGVEGPFTPEELAWFEDDERRSKASADAWSRGDVPGATEGVRQMWCSALEGEALELFRRMVADNPKEVFEDRSARFDTAIAPPAAKRLAQLTVPVTVLIGDRDLPDVNVFARRLLAGVPHARRVDVEGADHLVNLSRPAAFDSALADLFA